MNSSFEDKKISLSINHIFEVNLENNKYIFTNPNNQILEILRDMKNERFFLTIYTGNELSNNFNGIETIKKLLMQENIKVDEVSSELNCQSNILVYQGLSLSLQEFILKYKFQKLFPSISIVSSFYNEEKNIDRFWMQANELSKYLNIKEFIFVDNGSSDNTLSKLITLAKRDKRVKYLHNEKPTNYSIGFSAGVSKVSSEYTLVTHSDCQINVDTTIKRWLESSAQRGIKVVENSKICVFSYRLNRPPLSQFLSYLNNLFAKNTLLWPNLFDFNAQPKIIHSSLIKNFYFNKGYLFDLVLINWLNKLKKERRDLIFLKPIAVIDSPRLEGKSSWSSSPIKFIKITLEYIFCILYLKLKNQNFY